MCRAPREDEGGIGYIRSAVEQTRDRFFVHDESLGQVDVLVGFLDQIGYSARSATQVALSLEQSSVFYALTAYGDRWRAARKAA